MPPRDPVHPLTPPAVLVLAWTRFGAWLAAGTRTRWLVVGVLLLATLPVVCSWPSFPANPDDRARWVDYWGKIVQVKIDDPWHDFMPQFPNDSHEAKLNFRLLLPLIGHTTGTGMTGVNVTRFALQGVLLLALLLAAERACGDRLAALGVALAVAATYTGTCVWRDSCFWFDNCAQAFMALALLAGGPVLAGGSLLLALFVDERAVVALPLLLFYHWCVGSPRRVSAGLVAAVPMYLLICVGLGLMFHLHRSGGGLGSADVLIDNLEYTPLAIYFALEGGWIPVIFAVRGATGGTAVAGLVLLGAALFPVAAAGVAGDFTRGASYGFPATLAAAAFLRHRLPGGGDTARLRRITTWAAVVSLAVPNLFIMRNIYLESCAPVRAVIWWLEGAR